MQNNTFNNYIENDIDFEKDNIFYTDDICSIDS